MGNVLPPSSSSSASAASPLALLQNRFALIRLDGQVRVIDMDEMKSLKAGTGPTSLTLYKLPDATLVMQRFLEAQSFSCNPKHSGRRLLGAPFDPGVRSDRLRSSAYAIIDAELVDAVSYPADRR